MSVFLRQSLVPLEPREHDWLVKGAAAAWPDIYSLFREDPSLLNRQDFISGYTVLHWIAKHGDHRVLNTLWYVVFGVVSNPKCLDLVSISILSGPDNVLVLVAWCDLDYNTAAAAAAAVSQ